MELEAKETRIIIQALATLLENTQKQLDNISDDTDEYVHLSNDAMLIDTMILGFKEEYQTKFAQKQQ